MSLDKLVDLLANNHLYFTPLASYEKSDPFEGYAPKVIIDGLMNVAKSRHQQIQLMYEKVKHLKGFDIGHLESIGSAIDDFIPLIVSDFKSNVQATAVNCWHANDFESEAMWKLYSDQGKGIAIKTTVGRVADSINACEQKYQISFGKVKYLDFLDPELRSEDCFGEDNILMPLLKRASFAHEKEVRLFISPVYDSENTEDPIAKNIKIDGNKLIDKIVISPFSSEPFISSVYSICSKYEIESTQIEQSSLLDSPDFLFKLT
ncbi:DUF2971 domain-containing protein [Photobacterium carnosum]|uniref:DUF2971 domain-containing protein n=1 Tax=Photobacterium carnosum TaxID=2023717 RepID=UPI00242D89FC|nr:DUF2971 domain-containing protein [Photobacterium carnosum]